MRLILATALTLTCFASCRTVYVVDRAPCPCAGQQTAPDPYQAKVAKDFDELSRTSDRLGGEGYAEKMKLKVREELNELSREFDRQDAESRRRDAEDLAALNRTDGGVEGTH